MSAARWQRINQMSEAEFAAFLDQPRQCSKCGFAGTVLDFPVTRVRGKLQVRAWCKECLAEYYRARKVMVTHG